MWESFVAIQKPRKKQELEMDLKLSVLRSEVKRYRVEDVRLTERLLALIEVAKGGKDLSELSCQRISMHFGISSRTLRRWVRAYKEGGVLSLSPVKAPGRRAKAVRGFTAKKIKEFRKLYCWGAEVIQAHLEHDHGIKIGRFRIERYLKAKKLLGQKRKWRRKKKHTKVVQVFEPGAHTQMDVKHLTDTLAHRRRCYVYSFVDHASKWRFKRAYDSFGPYETTKFIDDLMRSVPFKIKRLQTDNGVEFTSKYQSHLDAPREHALERYCQKNDIRHVLIPPGEKELQGLVERNHRQDDEELYHRIRPFDLVELNIILKAHTEWCNSKRRRKILNWKTSNEFLKSFKETEGKNRVVGAVNNDGSHLKRAA
jgi:transposase